MRQIKEIEFNKSIAKKKLTYKGHWEDYFQTAYLFSFFGLFLCYFWDFIFSSKEGNNEVGLAWTILTSLFLVGLYILYRRIREPYLSEIKTHSSKQSNKELILNYFDKLKLSLREVHSDSLIFDEDESSFGHSYGKSYIVLLDDNSVYFTILKSGWKIDIPTLESHLSLRKDLKQILNSTN